MKSWKLYTLILVAAFALAGIIGTRVHAQGSAAAGGTYIQGATPDGSAPLTNPLAIAGLNGGQVKALQTDASGNLMVNIQSQPTSDFCESPAFIKSSASIAFSSATTTAIVPAVAGKVIYPCFVTLTMSSGTNATITFKSGTHTTNDCDTGTVTYPGTMAVSSTSGALYAFGGAGHDVFSPTAASAQFCITTGGTSPTGNGWITYVQP